MKVFGIAVGSVLVAGLLTWFAWATLDTRERVSQQHGEQRQNFALLKSAVEVINDEMRRFHAEDTETDPVDRILENFQTRLEQLPTKEDLAKLEQTAADLHRNQQELAAAFTATSSAAEKERTNLSNQLTSQKAMFETTVSEIGAHGKILEDAVFSLADIRDRQLAVAVTQQLAGASTFSGWTADGNTVYMHANKFPASGFPYWGPTGTPTDFVPVEWNIQV